MSSFFIPVLFIIVFIYGIVKKVKPYDAFTDGAKGAIPFVTTLFPFLVSIFVLTELFDKSGLSDILVNFLAPFFNFFGVPKELCKLLLIKPFSGSGSLAVVSDIYNIYGVDSYLSRCASVIYGSSETVFYIAAVYFAKAKTKKLLTPIIISLVASFFSSVFACFICLIL
ncbi:MAG: spore maturation protein [Clostridiales bacterium]|nr:spore maturation protein [Clostridiales bacterium]